MAEYSYDPWGNLRNPDTHALYAPGTEPELLIGRGFTGHEHLTGFGLINMNARLYDPMVGRFLSPDPYVQNPENTQSYNRYSYALNNPLRYTDPSGEIGYDTDRNCFVDDEGNRIDYSEGFLHYFKNGHFRTDCTIYGGGHSFWQWGSTSYSICGGSGGIGALPGHTWVTVYSSVGTMKASTEIWHDGSPILGELITERVAFNMQVPNTALFFNMADDILGAVGVEITGFELSWNYASAASKSNVAYHIQQSLKATGIRAHTNTIKKGITSGFRIVGKVTGVTSIAVSWYEYSKNPTTGNLIKSMTNTGLFFVKINPVVSLGMGILDLTGGSDWVFSQLGNVIDNNFY